MDDVVYGQGALHASQDHIMGPVTPELGMAWPNALTQARCSRSFSS